MGTGTGMAMGAEELGSNPLQVPVACAAFKLTTSEQVDKWTSGQPLRVCLGTVSIDAMQKCHASGLWMSRQFIRNPLELI